MHTGYFENPLHFGFNGSADLLLRFYGGEGTRPLRLEVGRSFFTVQQRRSHHLWSSPPKISTLLICPPRFLKLYDLFSTVQQWQPHRLLLCGWG